MTGTDPRQQSFDVRLSGDDGAIESSAVPAFLLEYRMGFVKQFATLAVIGLGLGTAVNPAFAQSTFAGFYGQVSTGYEHNRTGSFSLVGTENGGTPNTSTSATLSSDSMPLVIGLGYTFDLHNRFTLGVGIDYSALSQDTDTAGFSYPSIGSTTAYDYHVTVSNRLNVFLAPGYAIDNTKMAYLKLGYSNQQLQYAQNNCCSSPSNKAHVDGYLLGLGYKQMISTGSLNGLYGFVEANYQAYSKADLSSTYTDESGGTVTANPTSSAYNVLLGVGYRF